MRVTLATIAWMVSFVSSYSHTENILPDIENEDFIKDCVRIHNKFRSEVKPTAGDMLYMTWDPALAQIAKAWARNCQFSHNTRLKPPYKLHPNFTSLGENIWTGSVSLFSVSSAITNWYDEIQDYDFKNRICKKSVATTLRLFGQIVTKLAAQFNFALKFLALMLFPMEHILYATTDQEAITQLGHIREEPPAVPAPIMTSVWTISVLTNSETKSNVTTLLCIQAGPYIHVTDTLLSFSLLIQ